MNSLIDPKCTSTHL